MTLGDNKSTTNNNAGQLLAISIAMRMRRVEHIQGFTRSHWMPPSVECLRRIAPAATMVIDFK
jgi:hypothetical protein